MKEGEIIVIMEEENHHTTKEKKKEERKAKKELREIEKEDTAIYDFTQINQEKGN